LSSYQHQILSAPEGQYTVSDSAQLPQNRSRKVKGFLGQRHGIMDAAYILQDLLPTLQPGTYDQISGIAWYHNPRPRTATEIALGIENSKLLVANEFGALFMHSVSYLGNRFWLNLGAPTNVGSIGLSMTPQGDTRNYNVRTAQYEDELFIVKDDGLVPKRFFIDELGIPHLFNLGITTPATPTHSAEGVGLLTGDYRWWITYEDERGRESSPSAYLARTKAAQNETVAFTWGLDGQVKAVNIYRTLAGGTLVYYKVTRITNTATTTYLDNNTDLVIQANAQSPKPGENDPPRRASICAIHKERLWLDDRSIYDTITDTGSVNTLQVSNLNNPTGFSSVSDPEDVADGTSLIVGSDPGDRITGLFSFKTADGEALNVWKRKSRYIVYGDAPFTTADVDGYVVRFVEAIGCVAPDSIVRCGAVVPFLSDDGVRMIGYGDLGGASRPISFEVSDYFTGFVEGTVFA